MRAYEKSHPWITFTVDLTERVPPEIWLLLGEAHSKATHLIGTPLQPKVREEMRSVYLAKGALATVAIEGNTLSEEQVQLHLQGKLELPPSREYLQKAVDNVISLIGEVEGRTLGPQGPPAPVTVDELKGFNARILDGLPLGEDVVPGQVRSHGIKVGRYPGAPAEDCEFLLARLVGFVNEPLHGSNGFPQLALALVKAIAAHIHMAWIHPFGDGNGRVARMLELRMLLDAGLPETAAHLFANHYNLTRDQYYRYLDIAHQTGGDIHPFLTYALRGFIDGLREQIAMVKRQHMLVSWTNYVHECFKNTKPSPAQERRRRVALAVTRRAPNQEAAMESAEIPGLEPRLARSYAGKTAKTVNRDINALIDMDLVGRTGSLVWARMEEVMLDFTPAIRGGEDVQG
jgi:cell filamentation protein, protein adenylyltransferase